MVLAFGRGPDWVQFLKEPASTPYNIPREEGPMITTLDDFKDQVLPQVQERGNHADEASFLVALGNMYLAEGHCAKGIQQHEQAIRIHERFGESAAAARVYATIAKVYQAAGDRQTASSYADGQ